MTWTHLLLRVFGNHRASAAPMQSRMCFDIYIYRCFKKANLYKATRLEARHNCKVAQILSFIVDTGFRFK